MLPAQTRLHAASLQVVSSSPYLGDGRGVAALRLLSVLHPNIHPLLGQHWETTVPLLLGYLDGEAGVGMGCIALWGGQASG